MRRTREVFFVIAKVSCHDVGENEPIPIIIALATNVTFDGGVYDLKTWNLNYVCCHNLAMMEYRSYVTFVMALMASKCFFEVFALKMSDRMPVLMSNFSDQ